MTRAAVHAVRFAARTLPIGIRERYREEWLADLEGAAEAGVRASGVVVGALMFSATVHRDHPDVLGMPLSTAARRQARWAAALLLSAVVLAFGTWITGGFSASGTPIAVAVTVLTVVTVGFCAAGLLATWRAAAISSTLARIGAASLTAGVLALVASVTSTGWWTGVAGVVLLLAGTCIAAIAWAGSPAPVRQSEPVPTVHSRRWNPALIARRSARASAPRSAWSGVIATGVVAALAVAVGGIDLLVWSPLAQAPGYTLEEIWAALSPADRARGLGLAAGWIVLWSIAAILYVVGAAAMLGREARPATRYLVCGGLLVTAGAVFFQFWAGFSIGMSIADTLPPYTGGGSGVRVWYAMAGQASLVAALLLGVAPRAARVTAPAAP